MYEHFDHLKTGFHEADGAGPVPERSEVSAITTRSVVAMEGLSAQWRRGLTINAHERLAIMHLWESGSMTMSELGDRIPLSRAAITALTDRLERMGYVKRTADENDRRRTVLSLTERPYQVLIAIMALFGEDLTAVAEGYSDAEWQAVVRFLDDLHRLSHTHARRLRALTDDEFHELVEQGMAGKLAPAPA